MATAYTSLLGFALPVTGELSGTWGDTVNDSITKLVEDSIAGVASVSVTSGNVTLTTTGSGAANQARCAIIIATGTPGTARQIIAPSSSKAYIVINQSDSNVTFKGAATTGHTLKPGEANLLAWDGSDFMDIEQGDVAGPASATDNAVVRFDGTTGKLIQNSAVTIADTSGDIQTSGNIIVGDGTASLPSITNVGDTNTGIYFSAADEVSIATGGTQRVVVDATGDVGVGVTPSAWSGYKAVEIGAAGSGIASTASGTNQFNAGYYFDGANKFAITGNYAMYSAAVGADGSFRWYSSTATGTAGNTATMLERARITSGGSFLMTKDNVIGINTSDGSDDGYLALCGAGADGSARGGHIYLSGNERTGSTGTAVIAAGNVANGFIEFRTGADVQRMRITNAGYTQPVAYADTVVALGNTGTAATITLTSGNVFTATLTGNCTFTLSSPIATGSSSFTLILTNDGTAGRTVAWSGGNFRFPGGAASLSRTTTANAVDIWVFFTPDGGTTWYGNISMKNMAA